MLELRDDQLTLPIANESGFVNWFVAEFMPEHLTERYESYSEATLKSRVRHGRNVAIKHGFTNPVNQVQFVALMWRLGPHFYLYPGFNEATFNTTLSGEKKIDLYYERSEDEFADVMIHDQNADWFSDSFKPIKEVSHAR